VATPRVANARASTGSNIHGGKSGRPIPFELKADIATLYGEKFLEPLKAKPASAFIADGSYVEVQRRATDPEPDLGLTA